MDRVKGKVAIITGAASGLGKATARLLAEEGAKVVVGDINEDKGIETVDEIRRDGGEAVFMKLDVSSEQDWREVIKKTMAEFGKLDVLVNNAGVMLIKKIEEMTLDEWHWLLGVHVDGVFLGTKHAVGAMKQSGGGSIINMSSAAGIVGTPDNTAAYCTAKGAIRLFTKAAAIEFSKAVYDYNIRVNSVHPGVIETPMTRAMLEDETVRKNIEQVHPIGKIGEPKDIAYAVLYLASEESRMATGTELVIDGGWTAR